MLPLFLVCTEYTLLNSEYSKTKFIPSSVFKISISSTLRVKADCNTTLSEGFTTTTGKRGISSYPKVSSIFPLPSTNKILPSLFLYAIQGISVEVFHSSAEKASQGNEGTKIVKLGIFFSKVDNSSSPIYCNKSCSSVSLSPNFLFLTSIYNTS